jgi:hypothetical protein
MDKLTQQISALIPKSLDDIIRKNRELVELRSATEADILPLEMPIPGPYYPKDTINDWHLIGLCEKHSNWVQVLLLGYSTSQHCPWITSPVMSIDREQNFVRTRSGSLYVLGNRAHGEPPMDQLIHVCAALHMWGSGTFLGAPEFFY